MQSSLIDLMICPQCGHAKLKVESFVQNHIEIREGGVSCANCKKLFRITEGILLLEPESLDFSKLSWSEKQMEEEVGLGDEWLLSLPTPAMDIETSFESKGGDKALNFNQIWKRLALTGNERILELGAGTCWAMNRFASAGCQGVACDLEIRKYYGLRSAEVFLYHEKGEENYFDRLQMSFGRLPFKEGTFDIVFIQSALQFADDLFETLGEIHRVLKPGGKLVLIYQGVSGIFKRHKYIGAKQGVLDYFLIIRRLGMKMKLYFPASISYHFDNNMCQARKLHTLGKLFAVLWNYVPMMKQVIVKCGTLPMTILFGVPISSVITKAS